MKVKSKFWFEDEDGEVVFGEGRRKMLELIDELGSMQATAKALNMSYRGVWARIKATEERLNLKLVETSVGRGKDRGSKLTPEAKKLVTEYKNLTDKGVEFTDRLFDAITQGRELKERPMVPAIAVIGPTESDRRTFIADLIHEWDSRGIKAGVICLEPPAPDHDSGSADYFQNGAPCVIRQAGDELRVALAPGSDLKAEAVAANYCLGCRVVLVESSQRLHLPTIELYKKGQQGGLVTRRKKDILAVVGDPPEDKPDWPNFRSDDIGQLVDWIDQKVLRQVPEKYPVQLTVNGHRVPMLPFVQDFFDNAVTGMVKSLKSCDSPFEIELKIRKT